MKPRIGVSLLIEQPPRDDSKMRRSVDDRVCCLIQDQLMLGRVLRGSQRPETNSELNAAAMGLADYVLALSMHSTILALTLRLEFPLE